MGGFNVSFSFGAMLQKGLVMLWAGFQAITVAMVQR